MVMNVELHPHPFAIAVDVKASVRRGLVLSPVDDVALDSGAPGTVCAFALDVVPMEADVLLDGGRLSCHP